jgi:hypothetical protein
VERTKRIAERLPEFYRVWDTDSVIFKVVDAVGRSLTEAQKSAFRVMRTHWVDTANGGDIDRLGAIFELKRERGETDADFRARIKSALLQFKGGGTRASVVNLMADFLGADPKELELTENTERTLSVERRVVGGESWMLGSMSVEDATPVIEMTLQGEGNVVLNPAIRNLDSDQRVGLDGAFRVGQRLVLTKDSATLDGVDVSPSVSRTASFPTLTPGGSHWVYEESISAKVGHLNESTFGSSIFSVPVPGAVVRFTWSGRQPSTFRLSVPSRALREAGVTEEEAAGFLTVIKGAGVQAELAVKEASPS